MMLDLIKKFWIKQRIKFIVALTAFLAIIGFINFYYIFEVTAQSNDECLWLIEKISKDSTVIVFNQVKVDGVTWQAGIRDGDHLLKIDGVKTPNLVIASHLLDRVKKGDYATYTVESKGKIFETPILVKKLINFAGLGFALLSFIWIIVAFIVVMSKPDGKIQNLFYRVSIFSVLLAMSNLLYRGNFVENPIFTNRLLVISVVTLITFGAVFFPFVLVHFFCVFPKEFPFISKRWSKRLLYGIPATLIIIATLLRIIFVNQGNGDKISTIISGIINITILVGFILGLVLLFINYVKLKTKRERNSIFVILVAYTVGVVSLIYTNFLVAAFAGIIFNNPAYFTPIILIALLPIAFGYSIFRYSLMDLSDFVRNAVVYGSATVTLAVVYFFVIYLIGQSVSTAIGTEYQGIIAGAIFVVFAFVFQSTKDRFQNLLTEKFYPEQFAFQKSLLKFSNDVAGIVGYDNILDSTKKLFIQSLRLHHFGLMLKDKKENIFNLVRQQGIENTHLKIYDESNSIEKYFMNQGVIGKKPYVDRQDFKNSIEGKLSSLLHEEIYTVVPLIIQSKVIGLLLFGLKYSGSQFSGKDLDLLISAASQTAVSIENARLYESEVEKQKLEHDLENARRIQESLLPKTYPEIKGVELCGSMLPAMHVGGDYYDLIQISDKKFFVVIGDVSGKGLSASFYMSKLQTMIRLYCVEEKSPREILIEINKRIYSDIEKNWFITVSLALIDLENNNIKLSRAGHTPLLKINNGKTKIYQPAGVGVALDKGDLFQSSLEEATIPLESGDLLFFFSDGVTELMNTDYELYGFERMKQLLISNIDKPCKVIGKSLLDDFEKFRGNTPQYDDITFVIIKNNTV
jgi:serine phosphatase RsbU (regulator of sigma subunit)